MNGAEMDPLVELEAMKSLAEALTPLSQDARGRALRWAADHFAVEVTIGESSDKGEGQGAKTNKDDGESHADNTQFEDIADLYTAATTNNEPEKALIVGYWFQEIKGQMDFEAAKVNKELKHLGHGASNITTALSSLISRKPALVMQTKKSGHSQQARKKYKLTHAGILAVKKMLAAQET